MKVKTNRKIRTYVSDGEKLIPIGGFKEGKIICIRENSKRTFSNAKFPAVRTCKVKGVNTNVYIIVNPKNFSYINDNANGENQDCETSAYNRNYISDNSVSLDFETAEDFETYNDFGSEYPAEFNSDGSYCGADGLQDDLYESADGDGFKTVAEIARMKPKERRKYRRALKLYGKSQKAADKAANVSLNKSLASAVSDTSSAATPAAALAQPAAMTAAPQAASSGSPSTAVLIGGGVVFLVIVAGAAFLLTRKKKAPAAAAPAAAAK